ncbi:MAG TPA: ABC transporter permease [Chloroflexia bacterium]|nr:ABC transporter permease [Chloroflexia bacterium]
MIKVEVLDRKLDEGSQSQSRLIWNSFRRHRLGMVGLVMLSLVVMGIIFVPIFFPDPYRRVNPDNSMWVAPIGTVDPANGHVFWLGSDKYGRDNLSLVFEAGRLSLIVAFVPAVIILVVGFLVGAIAGYYGGLIDSMLMRVTDFMLALPLLPAYLIAIRIIRPQQFVERISSGPFLQDNIVAVLLTLIAVFSLFGWMSISRLVRGLVLSMRSHAYIEAARALGASTSRIIFRHLLPNTLTPMLIAGIFAVGDFIIFEAVLSYFGMGFRDTLNPPVVSWGNMLALNQDLTWFLTTLNPFADIRGFLVIFPSIMLFVTVLSINFIGRALRDVLDPRGYV